MFYHIEDLQSMPAQSKSEVPVVLPGGCQLVCTLGGPAASAHRDKWCIFQSGLVVHGGGWCRITYTLHDGPHHTEGRGDSPRYEVSCRIDKTVGMKLSCFKH